MSNKKTLIIAGVMLLMIFAGTAQIFQVSSIEDYIAYEDVPITVLKSSTYDVTTGTTLQPESLILVPLQLNQGTDTVFSFTAVYAITALVMTSAQYTTWNDRLGYTYTKKLENVANGQIIFNVTTSGAYYFIIYNQHTGSPMSRPIYVYIAQVTVYWKEVITTQVQVVKQRTTTKYITLLELILH